MRFGVRNDVFDSLSIDCISTVAILLETKTPSTLKGLCDQLPGLAAQPLIRMLSSKIDANKAIGISLVEAICVCAKKIGKFRWLPLYHFAARNAIMLWHRKFNGEIILRIGVDSIEEYQNSLPFTGLYKYDAMIQNFVSAQGMFESFEYLSEKPQNENNQLLVPDSTGHPLTHDLNPAPQSSNQKLSQIHLSRSWDVSQKSTREDWDEWMRHFAIQLLREAPVTALRATAELAYAYQPLARELFSAAFACCWSKLSEDYRNSLIQALKTAFFADVSPEILQTLLNLVEYAERDGIPGGLPIEIDILAELALKCRSYAKELHYKEKEYELGGGRNCIEDLITINRKLDLPGELVI
jgi:FKBP12-rapamycin complex-associated protein